MNIIEKYKQYYQSYKSLKQIIPNTFSKYQNNFLLDYSLSKISYKTLILYFIHLTSNDEIIQEIFISSIC